MISGARSRFATKNSSMHNQRTRAVSKAEQESSKALIIIYSVLKLPVLLLFGVYHQEVALTFKVQHTLK